MSYEKQPPAPMYPISNGYQQTEFLPVQHPQGLTQAPEIHPEPVSSPDARAEEREDDAVSVEGVGEPGYIPDKALNLDFEACFHEHKSTKTFKQLYKVLGIVYKYTKLFIYHVFVILIGIPMAILWAIVNGIIVFIHVWIYLPAMKITIFWVYAIAPLVTAPVQAIFTPLVDVTARIFRQIRIKATLNGSIGDKLAAHTV